jgi:four helix bundle protein
MSGIAAKITPSFPYPYPFPNGVSMTAFDHERLDVYRAAIDFVALADGIVEHLPRGRSHLGDQLLRAGTSIPLNIAEGAGEFSSNDKRRFYRMALRSATDCAAILDVCRTLHLADDAPLAGGRDLLLRIVSEAPRTGYGCGYGAARSWNVVRSGLSW